MRGAGQIRALAEIARPDVGVITAIAPVHLELLGSIENDRAREGGAARGAAARRGRGPAGARAGARAVRAAPALDVRRFGAATWRSRDGHAHVRCDGRDVVFSFAARHQAANAAAALTAREALGVPLPRRASSTSTFSRWRSQESELPGGGLLINDAWNANPVAMRGRARAPRASAPPAAARSRSSARWRSSARDAPRYHAGVGRAAASTSSSASASWRAATTPDEWVADGRGGGRSSRASSSGPGDVVLVKGSRSVGLEIVAEALSGVARSDSRPHRRARRAHRLDR